MAQNFLNSMQCLENFGKILDWRPLLEGWYPLQWGIMDPPLVTLVATFGFYPKSFGRWQGATNDGFTHTWTQLSGVDNQIWYGHSNPTYC